MGDPPKFNITNVDPQAFTGLTGDWQQILTGTGTPLVDPCAGGHHINEDLIEYVDGTVVGHCTTCRTRVVVDRVPGGVSLQRAKAVLASLMSLGTDNEVVDESEVLGHLSLIQKEIEAEEYALEEVREMVDLCRRIISRKIEKQSDE